MRRTLVLSLGFAVLAAPAMAADQGYAVTDFDRISVEGPYVVRLATGRTTSARATGSREALDRLTIDSQGQTLRIRPNRSAWGGNPGAQQGIVEVTLSTRQLRAGRVIGAGALDIDGVEGLRVDLTVEGSGRIRAVNVEADNLFVGVRGSGRIDLAGEARTLRADVQGSGDIDGSRLAADDVTLDASSTGNVALGPARSARINAGGLGEVTVLGRPACTVTGASAGRVRCGDGRLPPRQ